MKSFADISEKIIAAAARAGVDLETIATLEPLPEVFNCPVCEDKGMVSSGAQYGEPGFGRLFPCPNLECERGNQIRLRTYQARYKTARIPPHYSGLTFDSWNNLDDSQRVGKLPAAAAAYLFATRPDHYMTRADIYGLYDLTDPDKSYDRPKNCLMLFGAVGMGKTGLMAACANLILANGGSLIYIRAVDLIEEIQKRYGAEDYPTATDVMNDFKTAPLLFLDEFEVVRDSPDRLEKVESIIEARRANYKPTFMTSNLTQEGFRAAWGDRAGDRVINMAHWIGVEGIKLRPTEKPLQVI